MRTLVGAVAALCLVALVPLGGVPRAVAGAHSGDAMTVSGTGGVGLCLRDGAGLAAAIRLVIPEGAPVAVRGAPRGGAGYTWYPIAYRGAAGWAAGEFLAEASGARVQVTGTGGDPLRIRGHGGFDGAVLGLAPAGAVLLVRDGPLVDSAGNGWYAVEYDGLAGYASASYLVSTSAGPSRRQTAPAALAPARAAGPFSWPVAGPITNGFGTDPAFYGPGGHSGIDIANAQGTPLAAADAGVVIHAGWRDDRWGHAVGLDHGDGFSTWYGHAAEVAVRPGQRVTRGEVVAYMGMTGRATGPHLHFSVAHHGVYVDPLPYLSR